jgi:hypothetical protein
MQTTARLCTMALAAGALTIGFLFMPIANAQVQSPSELSTAPANISDSKLDAAATAARNAADIKDTFDQKLAQASVAEKVRIAGEADDAMVKAVTDQGLSLDEFKAIMRLAQRDPLLRSKLVERLK